MSLILTSPPPRNDNWSSLTTAAAAHSMNASNYGGGGDFNRGHNFSGGGGGSSEVQLSSLGLPMPLPYKQQQQQQQGGGGGPQGGSGYGHMAPHKKGIAESSPEETLLGLRYSSTNRTSNSPLGQQSNKSPEECLLMLRSFPSPSMPLPDDAIGLSPLEKLSKAANASAEAYFGRSGIGGNSGNSAAINQKVVPTASKTQNALLSLIRTEPKPPRHSGYGSAGAGAGGGGGGGDTRRFPSSSSQGGWMFFLVLCCKDRFGTH